MRTALPLKQGKIERVVDYVDRRTRLVHCNEDGIVDINFNSATPVVSATMVAGEDRMFDHPLPLTVTVKSGVFSFA